MTDKERERWDVIATGSGMGGMAVGAAFRRARRRLRRFQAPGRSSPDDAVRDQLSRSRQTRDDDGRIGFASENQHWKQERAEVSLSEFVPGQVWLQEYPIHFAGCDFNARMTVIRISDTALMVHSPCEIDAATKEAILALGDVAYIVAPGTYHHLYVSSAQSAFPDAETHICPGIERKRPELDFDWFLGDRPPEAWSGILDQVLVRGNKLIWEVAFYHRASKTLVLTDLIENFTDQTPNVNWVLKLWWKSIFHMWDNPKPAPEYQMGWKDKAAARKSLQRILDWDFDKIVIAHGDLIETDAKSRAMEAWEKPLRTSSDS